MGFVIPENFRTREDVAPSVARVGVALKNGLDDSATAWLEPPFDPPGGKPHFVVLLPDHGLAVIEVLDVRGTKVLGPLRGKLRIERDGKEVDADPLGRAQQHAKILSERVAAEPRLAEHRFPVQALAAFPSLDRGEAEAKGLGKLGLLDSGLFRQELEEAMAGTDGSTLERRLAQNLGVADPVEGDLVDLVRGLVQPSIVIDTAEPDQLTIFRSDGEDVVRVMDRRQESLAKTMGEGHRVVRGVAGSGKTLVLVYRARLFAEMYPQQRFLVTCFTRSLAAQLRVHLGDFDNIDVRHVHSLMFRAIAEAKLTDNAPKLQDDPDGYAAVAVEALTRGALTRYRAVFLDEAQDLGTNDLIFARTLADTRFDDLLVVADAAQNIFRKKFSWKQAGIQAQGRSRILRVNYRNTREILELASSFLLDGGTLAAGEAPDVDDENTVITPEAAARTGPDPTVVLCRNGDLVSGIVASAKDLVGLRAAPTSVAVLYMRTREGDDIAQALEAEGLEYFWATDPKNKRNRDNIAGTLEPILLCTIASAKGMEFPNVVLSCTPRAEDQNHDELRRTIYVGMTRATETLAVFADESHALATDLRDAGIEKGRLRVGIPQETL